MSKCFFCNRYAVLDDLTEISQLLRQIELEQIIKVECEEEVDRLSLELQRAQSKLKNQRLLVSEMRTRCAEARKRVKNGRRDCAILSQACQCLGQQIVGQTYRYISNYNLIICLYIQFRSTIGAYCPTIGNYWVNRNN